MKLHFVPPNDPILKKIAQALTVEEVKSHKYQELIDSMFLLARGEQDPNKKGLVGVAAPQVGFSNRIILVDLIADGMGRLGDLHLYINPEITDSSDEKNEWYEGCFSTDRFRGIVERPTKIKLKYLDIDGNSQRAEFSGYTARIFQHEIDHLNAKEFISHITSENNLHWVEDDQVKEYRNNQAWRNWPHKATFKHWREVKGLSEPQSE